MTTAYPTELPTEDIRTLFEIVTGRADRDIKKAAKAAWTVQGYLQGVLIGDPASASAQTLMTVNVHANLDDAQGAALLGALATLESGSGDVEAAGIGDLLGGALRRQLAGLILPILQRWLTEFLTGGGLQRIIDGIIGGISGQQAVAALGEGCCKA